MIVQIAILLIATGFSSSEKEIRTKMKAQGPCKPTENLINQYRNSFYDYLIVMYKLISAQSNVSFAFSPNSLWLALAGMAEGADSATRRRLFQFLHLSEDPCLRQEYYRLASDRISPGNDVNAKRTSVLAVDESLTVNSYWENLISKHSLLRLLRLPMKSDPEASIGVMEELLSTPLEGLNLTGNSVVLDAVEYEGLWRTAFADANIERSPFYNLQGEQTGYVDLMRMKKRVRMNYISIAKAKILELPIGADSRYRMLFAVFDSPIDLLATVMNFTKEMVVQTVDNLQETDEPVDVGIPRIGITSRIDVRKILEGVGVKSLWNEEAATRCKSEPAGLPSSFVQRTTISFGVTGVESLTILAKSYALSEADE